MKNAKKQQSHKITIVVNCLIAAAMVMLYCSCLSFDIGDWPSRYVYPHNDPPANWCGPAGAFFAYYLLYFIGPGVFILLMCTTCYLAAKLMGLEIDQIPLRAAGMCLLAIAVSSTFYCFWPHKVYSFPMGSGGVLGVAVITFLKSKFALMGSFILVLCVWFVGGILLADNLVFMGLRGVMFGFGKLISFVVPAWSSTRQSSYALGQIWQRLSAKQKEQTPADKLSASLNALKASPAFAAEEIAEPDETEQPASHAKVQPLRPAAPRERSSQGTPAQPEYDDYTLPPLDLLEEPQYSFSDLQGKVVKSKAAGLEKLLSEFNIDARVVETETGPVVTMFELELAPGVKVSQISSLANDMARALSAGAVRVVAPLPGKHTIGIEVPNSEKEKVRIKDIVRLAGDKYEGMQIPLFLGKDAAGEALVADLASMPHLLIAGTTGSGKSVCINSIIISVLLAKRPDEVKFILVDPKMVEMTAYNTIPHLMTPIVTETHRAVQILEWATVKMDERYALFAEARVKNITEYNQLRPEEIRERFMPSNPDEEAKIPKKLPYIVIVIDELADLMMTAPKEIEAYIVRLAQKSRAVGIHIVLATQRPQATVVTGLIKSNMPTRIGFRVAAKMDSRIILDQNGAEALLGQGDMLFLKPGTSDLIRAQGTFVDETEVKKIVKHLKEIAEPQFHPELAQLSRIDGEQLDKDDLLDEAVRIVLETRRGSVSLLQRRLSVGYARASRMIETMAAMGVLGEYKGSQAREVMITLDDYEKMRQQQDEQQQTAPPDENEEIPDEDDDPAYSAEPKRHQSEEDEE